MVEWFRERYVSREEHQRIVAYYRKLVAQLHVTVCELRTKVDASPITFDNDARGAEPKPDLPLQIAPANNVIRFDFRSRR